MIIINTSYLQPSLEKNISALKGFNLSGLSVKQSENGKIELPPSVNTEGTPLIMPKVSSVSQKSIAEPEHGGVAFLPDIQNDVQKNTLTAQDVIDKLEFDGRRYPQINRIY